MLTQAPRGTRDVLPTESYRWQYIEGRMRTAAASAGYREVRTPVFEHTELFQRGVGDTTDIVQKEMYTFLDRGDRSVTLKPEGTAGAVRCFLESGLYADALPCKMYYLNAPIFRYENPQSGRLREHHQFGLRLTGLCEDCNSRFERNPLRILDCKKVRCNELTKDAPSMLDMLCDECREHFSGLKECLDTAGIPYTVDSKIVRGLDYYTKTVFELVTRTRDGDLTVCGGGRYDNLVNQLGGPELPAVGFGMGLERVLMLMDSENSVIPEPALYNVFVTYMGKNRNMAFRFVQTLRDNGIMADMDHCGRSLKAQFKYANKTAAPVTAVIGDDEAASGCVKLKIMATGEENTLPVADAVARIQETISQE